MISKNSPITILALTSIAVSKLGAINVTWDGSQNNNWRNNSNWSGGGDPSSTDNAIFPAGESRNAVDLTNSSNDDVDRTVAALTLNTDGTDTTSETTPASNWYFRGGRVIPSTLYWRNRSAGSDVIVNGIFRRTSGTLTLSGDSSGSSNLQFYGNTQGGGTIQLSPDGGNDGLFLHTAQSFTGTYDINSGTLGLRHNNALPNATVDLGGSASLDLTGYSPSIGLLTGNRNISLPNTQTLKVGGNNLDGTFSGVFSGLGSLQKNGSGDWTLTANHSYQGQTIVNNGTLSLANTNLLPNSPVTVNTNGTLDLDTDGTIGNLSGNGAVISNSHIFTINSDLFAANTFSGTLNGSGQLTFDGTSARTWTNTPGNFSGDVLVNNGTLKLPATGFNNATVYCDIDNALTLGANTTVAFLEGSGDINLTHDLTMGKNTADLTFTGDFTGTGNLSKGGNKFWNYNGNFGSTGTFTVVTGTLSGSASFTGPVHIGGNGAISPGNSAGSVTFGSDLDLDGHAKFEIDGATNDFLDVAGTLDITNSEVTFEPIGSGVTEPVIIIASYGTLVGSAFDTINDLPDGFTINYAYDDGVSSNNIALVETAPPALASLTVDQNAALPTFNLVFKKPVLNFGTADLEVVVDGTSGTPVLNISGSGANYVITVTGLVGEGDVTINLASSASIASRLGTAMTILPGTTIIRAAEANFSGNSRTNFAKSWNAEGADFMVVYAQAYDQWDANFNGNNTATFGGQNMIRIGNASYNGPDFHGAVAIFYLINPPSGNQSLNLNFRPGTSQASIIKKYWVRAVSMVGVNTANPIAASGAIEGSATHLLDLANVPEGAFSLYGNCLRERIGSQIRVNNINAASFPGCTVINSTNLPWAGSQIGSRRVLEIQHESSESVTVDPWSALSFTSGVSVGASFAPSSYHVSTPIVTSVTPSTTGPTNGSGLSFDVTFSEDIAGLTDASDLDLAYTGTVATTGATITPVSASQYTITLTGFTGDGTVTLSPKLGSGIQDLGGTPLATTLVSAAVNIDTTPPTLLSATTAAASPTNAGSIDFTFTFSEAVNGFLDASDTETIPVSGTAAGAVTNVVNSGDDTTFTVTLGNLTGDGTIRFRVLSSQVSDDAGNTVDGPTNSPDHILDNLGPSVTSITPLTTTPTNSTTVSFSVVFDEDVSNFDALADLNIVASGTSHTGGSVTGSGDTYTVTLTGISGEGTIAIQVLSGMADSLGNLSINPSAISSAVTIDNTSPTVSITTAETSPTNANSISYNIAFSEPVLGFNNFSDLYITGTTTANTDLSTTVITDSGDSQNFTLVLNNISGDGFLQYRLRAFNTTDLAGNNLVINPTNTFDPFAPGLTIDNTAPLRTVVMGNGVETPTSADLLEFNITFNEPTKNVDVSDFEAVKTGTVASDPPTFSVIGNTYRITFANVTGDGTFRLRQSSTTNIQDTAGNSFGSPLQNIKDLAIDNTPPSLVSLSLGAAHSNPTTDNIISFDLVFDDSDVSMTIADLDIDFPGSLGTPTLESNELQVTLNVPILSGTGLLSVAIEPSNTIEDKVGFPLQPTALSASVSINSSYDEWVIEKGLTPGVNDDPSDDPDNDGKTNLEEFAFDGDPLSSITEDKIAVFVTSQEDDDHLALTLPVRAGATFSGSPSPTTTIDGIIYTIQGTNDLNDWTQILVEVTPAESAELPSLSSGWEYRTFRFTQTLDQSLNSFFRIAISTTP